MNKLFEMTIEDDMIDGVFAISLVDAPAIETDYILLSKEKENKISIDIQLEKLIDDKRHIVCGPALLPDIIIPRKGYDIKFSSETIRKISENFLINGNKDNVTIQHQVNVNRINLVESWIVEDETKDKATKLGYNVPVGTWMVSFKVNDPALWTEYIETGILKGFSIEGNFSQKEINLEESGVTHTEFDEEEYNDFLELKELVYMASAKQKFSDKDNNSYFVWKLGSADHCPECKKLHNQVKTLKSWAKKAIPRYRTGDKINATLSFQSPYEATALTKPAYSTYCMDDCRCKLVKVNKPSFKKKIIKKPF